MCINSNAKSLVCELVSNTKITDDIFSLHFTWEGQPPKAGQFFMVKPLRSCVFLGRPISVNEYDPAQNSVKFLIIKAGKGTEELSMMGAGEEAELTGPLGNAWEEFLPESVSESSGRAALIGGSVGIAPLAALVAEKPNFNFHLYAGFKNGFREKSAEDAVLGAGVNAQKIIVTAEDGRNAFNGRVTDFFFEPADYDVIFACGSGAMLKAVKNKCAAKGNTPCYVSMESRMACGTGACLGCVVRTVNGNRRCCADGPIFNAREISF